MNKKSAKSVNFENEINQSGFQYKSLDQQKKKKKKKISSSESNEIPKYVANRMARRIAIATGIPTVAGMGVFVGSYILITQGIAEIPPVVTLISSGTCFFVGLVGLSYGILSASWEKDNGSFFGIENIKPNISRVKNAFKANSSE